MCWPALWPSQPGTSRNRLFVRGVSGLVWTTSPTRQASLRGTLAISVSPVALLAPRVAMVVVAEGLPEARLVLGHEPEAPYPLGTLPEVEVRDEKAGGAAMLRREWFSFVGVGDPGLAPRDLFK